VLLAREESTLIPNRKLVGGWHRAVIHPPETCHAEQVWGFSGLTLEGKRYWKVTIALAKTSIQQKFIRFNFSAALGFVLQTLGGQRGSAAPGARSRGGRSGSSVAP